MAKIQWFVQRKHFLSLNFLKSNEQNDNMKRSGSGRKLAEHNEIELWSSFAPEAWENSINADDSFFHSLYEDTVWYVQRLMNQYKLTGFLEVGCGTGQIVKIQFFFLSKKFSFFCLRSNELREKVSNKKKNIFEILLPTSL